MTAFRLALSTLTVLPVGPGSHGAEAMRRSSAYYPLVGTFLGAVLAAVSHLPVDPPVLALLLLLLWEGTTGFLHLDGWADSLDAWFGGRTPAARRRILKDPRVGVFGTAGIVLALLAKQVLLTGILAKPGAAAWLFLVPAGSRWNLSYLCFRNPPRARGLGAAVLGSSRTSFLTATATVVALSVVLWDIRLPAVAAAALLAALATAHLARERLGGLSGDGLGAAVVASESAALFVVALAP
jgi:adenosylcobinamide-GDP ribazoletransferase